MGEKEILETLAQAVVAYDKDKAIGAAKDALKEGIDPIKALEEGLGKGIREVGEKFHRMEVFLPHLVMAAEAMQAASEVLTSALPKEQAERAVAGVVVLGTVKGDIHDIGKSLVATMLSAAGFKVIDVGVDVPVFDMIKKAEDANADIIAMSALMTTTVAEQKDMIEELKRRGKRQKFKVMVGGGATSKEWADEIGADGYGRDMKEAVETAKKLVEEMS
jgi:corrinoid protein of di/trimethylamine methyltransferase